MTMATIIKKHAMSPDQIEHMISFDHDKEIQILTAFIQENWDLDKDNIAEKAIKDLYNLGRIDAQNVGHQYANDFYQIQKAYMKRHNIEFEDKYDGSSPFVTLLEDLQTVIPQAYHHGSRKLFGINSPPENMACKLMWDDETAFHPKPKDYDVLCKRRENDEFEEDEDVFDERAEYDRYPGTIYRSTSSNVVFWLNPYQVAYWQHEQARCPLETLLCAAYTHGVNMQIAQNEALALEYAALLSNAIDEPATSHLPPIKPELQRLIAYGVKSIKGSSTYRINAESPLQHFTYSDLDIPDSEELQRHSDIGRELFERRKWLSDYRLDFDSRDFSPIMHNSDFGISLDLRECQDPDDSAKRAYDGFFMKGKESERRLEIPDYCKGEPTTCLEDYDDPETGENNLKDNFEANGFTHIKDLKFVNAAYKACVDFQGVKSYAMNTACQQAVFNAGFDLTHKPRLKTTMEP